MTKPETYKAGLILRSLIFFIAVISMVSCTGSGLRKDTDRPVRESYYRNLIFDSQGKPSFSERITTRPDRKGEEFFLLEEDSAGRPLKYYHITIKGGRADIRKPFRTVLERTAGGIKGGAEFAMELIMTPGSYNSDEAQAVLAFAAISVAVGTAGGITVGLVEGSYEAVAEIGRAFTSSEELLSFSQCDYDSRGRLLRLRAFEPRGPEEPPAEVFRIRYSYEGGSLIPSDIEVEDLPW